MTQIHPRLPVTAEQLADFCRRHHVIEFALFGSVTREDYRPDSDIDVMLAYGPDAVRGIHEYLDIKEELAAMFGRDVDVMTKGPIANPYRRASIEKDLTVIYAA